MKPAGVLALYVVPLTLTTTGSSYRVASRFLLPGYPYRASKSSPYSRLASSWLTPF